MEITDLYAHSLEGANDRIVSLGFFKANLPSGCDSKVEGTNYVLVSGWRTPEENGIELLSKYLEVMNMGGYTASNRFAIVMGPGYYDFGVETFKVTESYIDIVSLTGGCDVHFSGIEVSAANVILRGIDTGNAPFFIGNNLNKLICENCKGGDYSFGPYEGEVSGTFIGCTGGNYSFAYGGEVSGTFIGCTGGRFAFGGDYGGTASGTFKYCTGGDDSFGGGHGTASGTFKYCTGGDGSFGGGGEGTTSTSAKFYYCTGGAGSNISPATVKLFCAVNDIAL